MRATVTLLALIAALLLAACGGDGDSIGDGPQATLTDDGCTYEGDQTPTDGSFTIVVENQTDFFGAFALARLTNQTIDELKPQLEKAQQQFKQSGAIPPPPDYYKQIVRTGVEAGKTSALPADVPKGTYVLTCFVDDLPTWRVYAAAQIFVDE
jgi:hypothetical protein